MWYKIVFNMYLKILINIILLIFLGIIQIAFISGLPLLSREINLILIIIILLLGFKGPRMSYWWAFGFGFLLDNYLFVPFGANIFSLLITTIASNFLLTNFLTNRSLYSFLFLTSFAIICNEFFLYIIINFSNYLVYHSYSYNIDSQALIFKFYGLGINILIMGFVLYGLNHFGANFKPVFLRKRKLI